MVCVPGIPHPQGLPLNVGDELRRYEKMDVASHLVCDAIYGTTQRHIALRHKNQLRLDI